jgi:hypothetical protein
LIKHEEAAKKKLEQLGTEDTTELKDTYTTKLKELIDQQEVSPEDMRGLLHIFDSTKKRT